MEENDRRKFRFFCLLSELQQSTGELQILLEAEQWEESLNLLKKRGALIEQLGKLIRAARNQEDSLSGNAKKLVDSIVQMNDAALRSVHKQISETAESLLEIGRRKTAISNFRRMSGMPRKPIVDFVHEGCK